jgi:hypothetical protein
VEKEGPEIRCYVVEILIHLFYCVGKEMVAYHFTFCCQCLYMLKLRYLNLSRDDFVACCCFGETGNPPNFHNKICGDLTLF